MNVLTSSGQLVASWLAASRFLLDVSRVPRPAALLAVLAALFAMPALSQSTPLRIAGAEYLGDIPTFVVDDRDFFDRLEVPVRVSYNQSGRDNLELLRQGDVDFALMALTPLVLDRLADDSPARGDDPVVLASLVHSTRLFQVVTLAGSGINEPADLQGRRIGLALGTNSEFVWWLFAHYHELAPDTAELVDQPVAGLTDALIAGDVDAAVMWEPWVSRLRERVGSRMRQFPGSNAYTAKWVLVTLRRTAREQPARVRALLTAYGDAIEYLERHPQQVLERYSSRMEIDADLLRPNWQALDHDLNLDWSIVATFQQRFDWARQVDYARPEDEIDILSLIEAGPLRSVQPSRVGLPPSGGAAGADQQ